MTDTCKCFSCEFKRAIEAAFPAGVDRPAAETILAIIAVYAGQITAQLGTESLLEFSMRMAIARASVEAERPSGSVH